MSKVDKSLLYKFNLSVNRIEAQLYAAIEEGAVDDVKAIIKTVTDPKIAICLKKANQDILNHAILGGSAPLRYAMHKENVEIFAALLDADGIDVNKVVDGQTLLMEAVAGSNAETLTNTQMIGLLVQHDDINLVVTNEAGDAALDIAKGKGYHVIAETIEARMAADANIDATLEAEDLQSVINAFDVDS